MVVGGGDVGEKMGNRVGGCDERRDKERRGPRRRHLGFWCYTGMVRRALAGFSGLAGLYRAIHDRFRKRHAKSVMDQQISCSDSLLDVGAHTFSLYHPC